MFSRRAAFVKSTARNAAGRRSEATPCTVSSNPRRSLQRWRGWGAASASLPEAGLANDCAELTELARDTDKRAQVGILPTHALRLASAALILTGPILTGPILTGPILTGLILTGLILTGLRLSLALVADAKIRAEAESCFDMLQRFDVGINMLIVVGAAVLFLVTLQSRWKPQLALAHLGELGSIMHVIDKHQRTKAPSGASLRAAALSPSQRRTLAQDQPVRYHDDCPKVLSLAAKVAAVYAQNSKDPLVVGASSDLQQITANLSSKIGQKINRTLSSAWHDPSIGATPLDVVQAAPAAYVTPMPMHPVSVAETQS